MPASPAPRRPQVAAAGRAVLGVVLTLPWFGCGGGESSGAGQPVDTASSSVPGWGPDGTPPPLPEIRAGSLEADLVERAGSLAARPWISPDTILPGGLAGLGYSDYQGIRFREEAAVGWEGSPFELQFFHRGFLFTPAVVVHLVDEDGISTIPFDPELFEYGQGASEALEGAGPGLGFAGFRIHYPINEPDSKDEVAVFLGASYFRLLGQGHVHGLSSRGIAVDVVGNEQEEFPAFREFWVERPGPGDSTLVFYALLDGPSLTGAYRFELRPTGGSTRMDVDARLFARRDVARLGVAPLTSMFLYGLDRPAHFDDFRPRVHDSDGLLMHTSAGEWIWRPLNNRKELQTTALKDRGPRGFGLVQRARDFEHFLDLEARYHERPSQWVTVEDGDWGEGGVELVEIPSEAEFADNIVVYWAPEDPFRRGEERRFRYRLHTFDRRLDSQELAQVERTAIGWDALPGQGDPPPRSRRRFVIDFEAPAPVQEGEGVEAVWRNSTGQVSGMQVLPLPGGAGWRATFRLDPDGTRPVDLSLYLARNGERVTETWSHLWLPDDDD